MTRARPADLPSGVPGDQPIPPGRALRRPAPSGEVVPRSPVDHDDLDDDGPSPDDLERFGGVTRPCPACAKFIADDAQRCHFCGEWVTPERGIARMSTMTKVTVALAIVVLVLAILVRIL